MNALEAKKKAEINKRQRKLDRVDRILDCIKEKVEKGEFYTSWYGELDCGQIGILEEMGYKVEEREPSREIFYFISWENIND